MENIKTNYIPIRSLNSNENYLKVDIYYDLGGYSYFTNKSSKRGYYVSVTPVVRSEHDNYFSETIGIFRGYKYCLREVTRKSNKVKQEVLEINIDWLIKEVCNEYGLEIIEED